ncbi:hypothetical protein C8R44DRAFT_847448 [Mycena epipterygia]|nr:hypothetical protein C8R44DRAFT_847448 [Mycena epipterygia]
MSMSRCWPCTRAKRGRTDPRSAPGAGRGRVWEAARAEGMDGCGKTRREANTVRARQWMAAVGAPGAYPGCAQSVGSSKEGVWAHNIQVPECPNVASSCPFIRVCTDLAYMNVAERRMYYVANVVGGTESMSRSDIDAYTIIKRDRQTRTVYVMRHAPSPQTDHRCRCVIRRRTAWDSDRTAWDSDAGQPGPGGTARRGRLGSGQHRRLKTRTASAKR